MLENEQKIRDFLTEFRELTAEQQKHVYWLAGHMDILDLMVHTGCLTSEEADIWLQQAAEKKDYLLTSLILYKQIKDRNQT